MDISLFVLSKNHFAGVPPHQDVSYNDHLDDFFVMWVPFCSIDEKRGGVKIYKGTNHPSQISVEQNDFWLSGIRGLENSENIHFSMEKGDVLLLNRWIVHASMPNLSEETRISTDFRFFYGSSKKHYFDLLTNQVIEPEACTLTQ